MKVANRSSLRVEGEGTVKLTLEKIDVSLKKVLLVPEICANLLSVSAMTAKGLRLIFEKSGCSIENEDGEQVATAKNVNDAVAPTPRAHRQRQSATYERKSVEERRTC